MSQILAYVDKVGKVIEPCTILATADADGRVYTTDDEGKDGVWRTVRGRHVFIREGEDVKDAIARSLANTPKLENVVEELEDKYGIRVESELKDEVAAAQILRQFGTSLEGLTQAAPFIDERLRHGGLQMRPLRVILKPGKTVWNESHGRDSLAYYNIESNEITIAGGLRSTPKQSALRIGTRDTGNIGSDFHNVITHEIGHAVGGRIASLAIQKGVRAGHALYTSKGKSYWQDTISYYAGTNSREMMAEAFAAYTHPRYGSQGKRLPKEIEAVFEAAGVKPATRKYAQIPSISNDRARSQLALRPIARNVVLAYADAAGHVYAEWDESKHPRDDQGQWSPSVSRVPAFAGVRADVLAELQVRGINEPVLLTTSLVSARWQAQAALLNHGGGHALVLEVRVPVAEVLRVKPEGLWPGRGFSFVRETGVPAAWISGVTEAQAFAESESVIFYLPVVLKDKKAKSYSISRPLYVSRPVENADEIIAWAKSVGFTTTLPAEDMHVTVCYSREPVDWLALEHWVDVLEIPPEGVRTLAQTGKKGDEEWRTILGRRVLVSGGVEGLSKDWENNVDYGREEENTDQKALQNLSNKILSEFGFNKDRIPFGQCAITVTTMWDRLGRPKGTVPYSTMVGEDEHVILLNKKAGWALDPTGKQFDLPFFTRWAQDKTKTPYSHFLKLTSKDLDYMRKEAAEVRVAVGKKRGYTLDADRTITNLGEDGAVVLQFDSAPLQARHQYFLDHGASWDYDAYHPHITLTYAAPEGLDLSMIEPYTGRIVLGPEKFTELETGWAEDIEELAQEDGVWRTIRGRRVFIREGEDFDTALARSLKEPPKARRGEVIIYHGTTSSVVDKIRKEGLLPLNMSEEEGVRGRSVVFATDSLVQAKAFAIMEGRHKGVPVVLELKVPTKMWKSEFKIDHRLGSATAKYRLGKIPPQFIVGAIEVRGHDVRLFAAHSAVEETVSVYVALVIVDPEQIVKEHADQPTQPFEIDYAQIKNDLDAMEAKFRDELREVLFQSRDATLATIKRNRGELPKDFKLPYTTDIQGVIKTALQRALDRGEADAGKEIGRARKQVKGYAEGGEWKTINGRHVFIGKGESVSDAIQKGNDVKTVLDKLGATAKHISQELRADPDLDWLASRGEFIPVSGLKKNLVRPNDCHRNVSKLFILGKIDTIVTGYAAATRPGSKNEHWYQHSWGLKGGKIVETTAGGYHKYFGVKLTKQESTAFAKRNHAVPGQFSLPENGPDNPAWSYPKLPWRDVMKEYTLRQYAKTPTFTPKAALKWLRAKVFWVADVLTGGLLEDIRLAIINGLKYGKPTNEIVTDIAQVYIPYLGDPTAVQDGELPTAARLETVVRTNVNEAYNQGRIATFIKPDMMPFLDAIRYSSIMDTRTTPICQFLHNKLFRPEDIVASGLVPPNHFGERALVVPVVVGEISKPPDFKVDPKVYITDEEILHAQALADAKFLEQVEDDDVHTHEWDESRHPRDEQGQWATIGIPKQSMESPKLHLDNPGGDWLAYERERSSGSGRDVYGAPNRWGEVTGSFSDDVLIPIDKLSQVPGLRGEQQNVRQGSLEDLMSHMKEKGRLPLGRLGGEYVPFIQVAYDGSAWMNEGNHRVMAAKALGWKYLPVEIRYFAGGEQAGGEWSPEKLLGEDAALRKVKRYAQEEEGVWRTVRGRRVFIREGETPTEAVKRSTAERTARSLHSHIPATKERQLKAAQYEETVAKLISGKNLDDHEPFDVIKGQHAVEVKTILSGHSGNNPQITMHPDSLERKNKFLRKEKMTGHTVVIDARGAKPVYYYRERVGSFRLDNMKKVKGTELKGFIT